MNFRVAGNTEQHTKSCVTNIKKPDSLLRSGAMVNNLVSECSFTTWYPQFCKDAVKATVLSVSNDVQKYLEHDAFVLPAEAVNTNLADAEWTDGSPVVEDQDVEEFQPSFPEFSQKVQDVIEKYGAVFIKSNWSSPLDATWVAPTKTLKCVTLEEVYLLLKSSDRIVQDLQHVKKFAESKVPLEFCLILKQWYDINPCTEFRCFVMDKELVGISQRDISQYHSYNESEKYNIQSDIRSLFMERIKERFPLANYCFDVIRFEKDKVKILDFGPMDESTTKGTLFTYEELRKQIGNGAEFRYIAEDIGIQPKPPNHFCIPREIHDFFQTTESTSVLDNIQREVENQQKEHEITEADDTENA